MRLLSLACVGMIVLAGVACSRQEAGSAEQPLGAAAEAARELTPDQIAERIARADELVESRRFGPVVDLLQPVVSLETVPPAALEQYGRALLMTNRASLAVWPLARAAAAAEPASDVAWLYARSLFVGGDGRNAIEELDRLIALVPEAPRLIRLRAQSHARELDHEAALADLDALIELAPDELEARETRIELLRELGQTEEARAAIAELGKRLEALDGTVAAMGRHCAAAALFEQEQGENETAREMLLDCLELYPVEPDVVLPWVLFLDAEGEGDLATAALEEAVAGPGSVKLRLRIALAGRYAAGGRREEVAQELSAAAQALNSPQPLLALADYRVAWEDLEGAREAVYRAVEMQVGHAPGSPDFSWSALPPHFRFAFGDILIRSDQTDEAAQIIESLEADPAGEEVYPLLLKARLALEQQAPEEALELFEESFKFWPGNVGARYLAGRAAMELGQFDRGLSLYQDAFRADPAESDAGFVLARMQLAQGQVGPAGDSLATLLGVTSEDPEPLRLFANVATRIGAFEAAETTRMDLAARFGWADQALADQAAQVSAVEGSQAAIRHLEQSGLFDQPDYHESLFVWFLLQSEEGTSVPAAALERLEAMRKKELESAGVELVWANVLRSQGDLEQAIVAAREALERDPMHRDAAVELGRLLLDTSDWEEAESAFQRVLDAEPGDLDAAMGIADASMGAGRTEEAERRYYDALVQHPWHGRAARALARIALERGDFDDRALIWARWAARFNEGDTAAPAALLAEMRLARGEPTEAAAAIAVAIESAARVDPRWLYLLGRALSELDDPTRAVEVIEDALRLGDFPEAQEARELLARLRSGEQR